jgi:hypothetical protein
VKQTLFDVFVHCNHTMDWGRMTWRHDSILKHIAGCLKSTLESLGTVELYCDLEGLQAPGEGLIPAHNDPVSITPRLGSHHIDGVLADK